MIDFIGIGAQKCGTSWVYSCLYEHPEICAPLKEIHFFSRPRYEKGTIWYESHFADCAVHKKRGEFSTSYLYSVDAPQRIYAQYPQTKIIAIVRNPVERAFSHYRNAIKSGEITKHVTFTDFYKRDTSVLGQGKYYEQLERYIALFPPSQLLVLVHEDSKNDPADFIKKVFAHIGVDTTFIPSMLHREVNIARTPRFVFLDRVMHHTAEFLRIHGLHRLVHFAKVLGITDIVRGINTDTEAELALRVADRTSLRAYFASDVEKLSRYLERDMNLFWNI